MSFKAKGPPRLGRPLLEDAQRPGEHSRGYAPHSASASDDAYQLIATVPKNAKEVLQVAIREFKGYDLLDLRVFVDVDEEEPRPTQKGISLRVTRMPALIEALKKAQAEAERRGLLPEGRE